MKRLVCLLALAAIPLAGCVSRYDVMLRNGQTITAKSKPKEDGHGNYVFKDAEDKETRIPMNRVIQIDPRPLINSGKQGKNFKYLPAN